jgi:hypothetical protein
MVLECWGQQEGKVIGKEENVQSFNTTGVISDFYEQEGSKQRGKRTSLEMCVLTKLPFLPSSYWFIFISL